MLCVTCYVRPLNELLLHCKATQGSLRIPERFSLVSILYSIVKFIKYDISTLEFFAIVDEQFEVCVYCV